MSELRDKLWKATEIQDKIVDASVLLAQQIKQALKSESNFIRDYLINNPKANSYQLKSLISDMLTCWNESISPDTEQFWIEIRKNNIGFVRKEPLRFALAKNRFRNVEQGIDAKNHWHNLRQLPSIVNNYTRNEIEKIDRIIEGDERKRYMVLKKMLSKKKRFHKHNI